MVLEHLETFLADARLVDGDRYPRFVEQEFRRYLECGILAHGFARLRCPGCGYEHFVAFSCKGRLCPSCQSRRMADTAAFLVDELLPAAPYRQWVLTFPWVLRARLSVDRRLLSALLGAFLRTVFAWQRRRGRALGIAGGRTGAVSFVQRFGSALNLHPHVHSVLPDGLFVLETSEGATDERVTLPTDSPPPAADWPPRLRFVPLPPPTQEEIEALTQTIARRLTARVERSCSEEYGSPPDGIAASMQQDRRTTTRCMRLSPPSAPGKPQTPARRRARLPLRVLASPGHACSSESCSLTPCPVRVVTWRWSCWPSSPTPR